MSGEISSQESSRFVFLLRPLFAVFGCTDEHLMTFVIRKTAHFSEYAVLAMIAHGMLRAWGCRGRAMRVLTLPLLVLPPAIDESIQLSVPGRAGQITDVCIDLMGGLFGLLVACVFERLRHHKHHDRPIPGSTREMV